MKILIFILLIFLCGCGGMTNDEIISEAKKCKDAGLTPKMVYNAWTYEVGAVKCWVESEEQ